MLVVEIVDQLLREGIKCHWFAGEKLQHGTFPIEALEKVEGQGN
jgi:hypothetical protein